MAALSFRFSSLSTANVSSVPHLVAQRQTLADEMKASKKMFQKSDLFCRAAISFWFATLCAVKIGAYW